MGRLASAGHSTKPGLLTSVTLIQLTRCIGFWRAVQRPGRQGALAAGVRRLHRRSRRADMHASSLGQCKIDGRHHREHRGRSAFLARRAGRCCQRSVERDLVLGTTQSTWSPSKPSPQAQRLDAADDDATPLADAEHYEQPVAVLITMAVPQLHAGRSCTTCTHCRFSAKSCESTGPEDRELKARSRRPTAALGGGQVPVTQQP